METEQTSALEIVEELATEASDVDSRYTYLIAVSDTGTILSSRDVENNEFFIKNYILCRTTKEITEAELRTHPLADFVHTFNFPAISAVVKKYTPHFLEKKCISILFPVEKLTYFGPGKSVRFERPKFKLCFYKFSDGKFRYSHIYAEHKKIPIGTLYLFAKK